MKKNHKILILCFTSLFFAQCFSQTTTNDKKAIADLIQASYIQAAYNQINIDALKKGFHENFTWQWKHHDRLFVINMENWIKDIEREKEIRPEWNNRTSAQIQVIALETNTAVAKVKFFNNKVHERTDFISIYKFSDGWKITNMISQTNEIPPEIEYQRRVEWENSINERLQPPEKVMDAVGIKPGMVIGEIGAGYGRYTVHLARRVGSGGKIYANDIDKNALSALRDRCEREKITNVEAILGEEEDPLFPEKNLDMAFMVWVFHGLEKPGPLLRNVKPYLKPGAPLVIVDPIDSEIDMELEFAGEKLDPNRLTIRQRVEKAADESGFKLVRVETFLPKDYIFVLNVADNQ